MEGRSPQLGRVRGSLVGYANRGSAREQSRPPPLRDPGTAKDVRHAARSRVAVIGLDCGTPQLLFRATSSGRSPTSTQAHGGGMHGDLASISRRSRSRVGLRDDRQDPGSARPSTASATARTTRTTACRSRRRARSGARRVGQAGREGHALVVDRRAAELPAARVHGWRIACFLTPPSANDFAYPRSSRSRSPTSWAGGATTSSTSRTSASRASSSCWTSVQDDRAAVQGGADR